MSSTVEKNTSKPADLTFVGEDLLSFLENNDVCFGKHYDYQSPECDNCRAVVMVDGRVRLMREVCKMICRDGEVSTIRNLGSRQVQELLTGGATVSEIFNLFLHEHWDMADAEKAYKKMKQRFRYLENEKGYAVPEIPPLEELID